MLTGSSQCGQRPPGPTHRQNRSYQVDRLPGGAWSRTGPRVRDHEASEHPTQVARQDVELTALVGREGGVHDPFLQRPHVSPESLGARAPGGGREDEPAAAIVRVGAPLDEAATLQLVEDHRHVVRAHGEGAGHLEGLDGIGVLPREELQDTELYEREVALAAREAVEDSLEL